MPLWSRIEEMKVVSMGRALARFPSLLTGSLLRKKAASGVSQLFLAIIFYKGACSQATISILFLCPRPPPPSRTMKSELAHPKPSLAPAARRLRDHRKTKAKNTKKEEKRSKNQKHKNGRNNKVKTNSKSFLNRGLWRYTCRSLWDKYIWEFLFFSPSGITMIDLISIKNWRTLVFGATWCQSENAQLLTVRFLFSAL